MVEHKTESRGQMMTGPVSMFAVYFNRARDIMSDTGGTGNGRVMVGGSAVAKVGLAHARAAASGRRVQVVGQSWQPRSPFFDPGDYDPGLYA